MTLYIIYMYMCMDIICTYITCTSMCTLCKLVGVMYKTIMGTWSDSTSACHLRQVTQCHCAFFLRYIHLCVVCCACDYKYRICF